MFQRRQSDGVGVCVWGVGVGGGCREDKQRRGQFSKSRSTVFRFMTDKQSKVHPFTPKPHRRYREKKKKQKNKKKKRKKNKKKNKKNGKGKKRKESHL